MKKLILSIFGTLAFLIAIGAAFAFYPISTPPERAAADVPGTKKVSANGIELAYIEAGTGPLVILLHGFPDSAYTWEEVLPRLAANGYHAVALFTRGYYPSEIPADGDYSMETIGRDVLGVIDALGYQTAVIVGQDWGASEAYAAANIAPEKITKLVTLAIPHPRVTKVNPQIIRRFPHFLQFQFGPLSEWYAGRNNFAYLEYLTHYWSPSWDVPESQIVQMKENMARPGRLAAALRYYHFGIFDGFDARRNALYKEITRVPTLTMVGEEDGLWELDAFENIETAFGGPFELAVIPDAGHFLHREQPEIFASKLIEFLAAK